MAEFPAMPLWTDAYLGDTTHLTTIEHGAYLLLLITMWRTKAKNLPDDDRLLARYARLSRAQWQRLKPTIAAFFDIENGVWTQGRLTDEANAVKQNSKRQSDRSKARWLKNKTKTDTVGMPDRCRSDATLTLTHIQEDSEAIASAAGAAKGEPENLAEIIFGAGLAYLIRHGVPERQARPLLGKWRSEHGDAATLKALRRAQREGASDPKGFCAGVLRANGGKKGKADERFERIIGLAAGAGGRTEGDPAVDRGAGTGAAAPRLAGGNE